MSFPKRPLVAFLLPLLAFAIYLVAGHPRSTGRLRAVMVCSKGDIGIPGISKMYEARVSNGGLWPVRVCRCDAIDDAGGSETMVAYAVEKWEPTNSQWRMVVAWDQSSFCKPYPLGIVQAHLREAWLWPTQSLSTGEEATAARLHKGDFARFVIFTAAAGDYSHAVATDGFLIDEEVTNAGAQFRIRH